MIRIKDIKPGCFAVFGSLGCGSSIHEVASVDGDFITLTNGEVHFKETPHEYRAPFRVMAEATQ